VKQELDLDLIDQQNESCHGKVKTYQTTNIQTVLSAASPLKIKVENVAVSIEDLVTDEVRKMSNIS
jgi:hypothetical protein